MKKKIINPDFINDLAKSLKINIDSWMDEDFSDETSSETCVIFNEKMEPVSLTLVNLGLENLSLSSEFLKLSNLNLSNNLIEDITFLKKLKNLATLYLGGNKISDVSPLVHLEKLEVLALWLNPILNINHIGKIKSLERLYLQSVNISNIDFMHDLLKLEIVSLEDNEVKNISTLAKLPKLKKAFLNNNQIEDLNPLEGLVQNSDLEFDLEGNLVKNIELAIARKFHLIENGEIPENGVLSDMNHLEYTDNILTMPPYSVLELGSETLKNYYDGCQNFGKAPLSEGRIIFIGDGSSGKSSLIEKLLHGTFTLGRKQTNGIKIEQLNIRHPEDNRDLVFNIWDFGGQEIQHAVHKFFFTEGCLYVLVLDNRKEEEPEYWLQQIESLAGGAPVIIVFNKQDENPAETADRKYLKEKYPNIVSFFNTSCQSDMGIVDFKNRLLNEVVKLQTVDEEFPKNWLSIKKAIQRGTSGVNNYIKYEYFKMICDEYETTNENAQKLLLKYFNTIGSVTWFGEDTHLKFFHVLNPAWITQGVYKILTAEKTAQNQGRIKINDFGELLKPTSSTDYKYSEDNYVYLLNMMKKFELCDSSDDKNLLIPSAFGKMPKVEYSEYKGDDVRIYILQFRDYMPLALIHRFTAKKISEALDDNFWYTGIVLKDSKSNTLAMVHADREAKRIYVRIKGAEKLGMWEYIRRDLSAIASSYASIPYDELVSLDGNVENNVSYSDLTSYIQSNKAVYYHPKIKRDFNVGYLIGLFESKEGTINKFEANNSEIKIRGERPEQVPNYVIQILNNNTPNITTHIETNISINVIQELSSSLKGDLSYLISELNESNNEIIKSLETLINFANESKSTTDINQIRENGWARKIKSALGVLSKYGDEIKKVDDGAGALKSLMNNIKQLSGHFKLNDVIDWINQLLP